MLSKQICASTPLLITQDFEQPFLTVLWLESGSWEFRPVAQIHLKNGFLVYEGVEQATDKGTVDKVDLRDSMPDEVLRDLERLVTINTPQILEALNFVD